MKEQTTNRCAGHLPGHHAAYAGPSTPAHKETHRWVCDSIPGAAHKEDDGGIEGIQLERRNDGKSSKEQQAIAGSCCLFTNTVL